MNPLIETTSAQLTTIRLWLTRPLRNGEAPALRGFFGRPFEHGLGVNRSTVSAPVCAFGPVVNYGDPCGVTRRRDGYCLVDLVLMSSRIVDHCFGNQLVADELPTR